MRITYNLDRVFMPGREESLLRESVLKAKVMNPTKLDGYIYLFGFLLGFLRLTYEVYLV